MVEGVGAPETVAIVFSIVGILVALVSTYREHVDRWFSGEFLRLEWVPDHVCGQRTFSDEAEGPLHPCVFYRLWVTNTGGVAAEGSRVLLAERRQFSETTGSLELDETFVPIHLRWMHAGHRDVAHEGDLLPPKGRTACNLGSFIPPGLVPREANRVYQPDRFPSADPTFILYTQKQPQNNSSMLCPGRYVFSFELYTRRGRRGAGEIDITVPPHYDSEADPNDVVKVVVRRSGRRHGQAWWQRQR